MDTQFCLKLKVFPLQQSIKELLSLQDVIWFCWKTEKLKEALKKGILRRKGYWFCVDRFPWIK